MANAKWYRDGLRFECTQCGKCCGGAPGYCWVSEDEIFALADRLGMSHEAFRRRYTRKIKGRGISLQEKANYDCIFFDKKVGCTVYEHRPKQCRTWPFWQSNVRDRDSWVLESQSCPGMDKGALHPVEFIEKSIADDGLAR